MSSPWRARLLALGCLFAVSISMTCGDARLKPILPAPGSGGPGGSLAAGGFVGVGGTAGTAGGIGTGNSGGGGAVATGGATLPPCPAAPPCPTSAIDGYAAYSGGTTGGGAATVVTAGTEAELKMYATMTVPLVIQIAKSITLTAQVRPASNKTIVGMGTKGALTGGGLYIIDVSNVIVRNLTISKVPMSLGDPLTIQNSQHVWIDHCDLYNDLVAPKGTYDALLDITHASDFVTVSWTRLHENYDASVIGHSDKNAAEDTNHLTVTYHHNWFSNVLNDSPRVRFGSVHVFNNYYQDGSNIVISQMAASMLVELNVFSRVSVPITTSYADPTDGKVNLGNPDNNLYLDTSMASSNLITMTTTWTPPYNATIAKDSAESVRCVVPYCAGVGKGQ